MAFVIRMLFFLTFVCRPQLQTIRLAPAGTALIADHAYAILASDPARISMNISFT